ncbi:MAG: hypothetical protein ACM3S4_00940 [Burkholderiales bacterium]
MERNIVVLFVLLAVLVVAFAGCGAPANDISGLWYETTGLAGTLEFKSGGVVSLQMMGMSIDGTYKFDAATGKGTIIFTEDESESDFELKDGKINLDGMIYTRDKVEQKDPEEIGEQFMEGLEDALTLPSN